MVDIRISTDCPFTRMLKRPSCGRRFSEISRFAINFKRSTKAEAIFTSWSKVSCNTPSIRWRKRSTLASGSICISEAPT
ncbi:Uncharacterised protein [Vibrio cholerae]|uniref:Uncharacterized protein n=1 Tax=Vibrio cholerae TaxID=666 RepID=A0A655YIW0_VIBCL|nr:Uncharacterised protein [Vibrio cholerae]CSD01753.1 Uncharacterised protein [Vibrio cholerae]